MKQSVAPTVPASRARGLPLTSAQTSPANRKAAAMESARPLMYATASVCRGWSTKRMVVADRTNLDAPIRVMSAKSSMAARTCQAQFVTWKMKGLTEGIVHWRDSPGTSPEA